ncbi:MAG: hypothetical protein PHX82_15530, partial [Paracoccaceae bacterium]|nr:hypothetical protein [Paracoccaceae bacterium]
PDPRCPHQPLQRTRHRRDRPRGVKSTGKGEVTPQAAVVQQCQPALTPAQQVKANALALDRLRIEVAGKPVDAGSVVESVRTQNAERDWRSTEQDAREVLRRRQAVAASADWSDLDRLAMIRAAIWIAHADAYGQGVTYGEVAAIRRTGHPEGIAAAARAIVLRLSQIVAAPDADGLALARSDALAGIVARDDQ